MKTVQIKPVTSYRPSNFGPVDGWLSDEFLRYGAPTRIVEENVNFPDLGEKGFIVLAKAPGSDIHKFPEAMAALGQKLANHQYGVSLAAHEKACIVTYRNASLANDQELFANEWHAHAIPKKNEQIFRLVAFFYALFRQREFCPRLFTLCADMALNEYILSDKEPTVIQSDEAKEDLLVQRLSSGLVPKNVEAIPYARTADKSLLFVTSQNFHRAPATEEYSPENVGTKRRFLDVMYMPTNAAKALIGSNQGLKI